MNKQKVIDHFDGVSGVAAALRVTPQAVYLWPDPIPEIQAWRAQQESGGALQFDWKKDYLDRGIRPGPRKQKPKAKPKKQ